MTVDIEAFRALEAKATPGPWVRASEQEHDDPSPEDSDAEIVSVVHGLIAHMECDGIDEWSGNVALIVAMRNALPELLEEVERLRDDNYIIRSEMSAQFSETLKKEHAADRDEIRRLRTVIESERSYTDDLAKMLRSLLIDANRLLDRRLGGTYEDDVRATLIRSEMMLMDHRSRQGGV